MDISYHFKDFLAAGCRFAHAITETSFATAQTELGRLICHRCQTREQCEARSQLLSGTMAPAVDPEPTRLELLQIHRSEPQQLPDVLSPVGVILRSAEEGRSCYVGHARGVLLRQESLRQLKIPMAAAARELGVDACEAVEALVSQQTGGWNNSGILYLSDIWVLPQLRGKGYGAALLEAIAGHFPDYVILTHCAEYIGRAEADRFGAANLDAWRRLLRRQGYQECRQAPQAHFLATRDNRSV